MKSLLMSVTASALLAAGLIAGGRAVFAEPTTAPTTAPTTSPSAAAKPKAINEMCIVETDHPVDDRVYTVYNGQVIGFCCEDCQALFKKDPERYVQQWNLSYQPKIK